MNEIDEIIWLDDIDYASTIDLSSVMGKEDRKTI